MIDNDNPPTLKTSHATVSLKVDAAMVGNENGNFEICRRKSFQLKIPIHNVFQSNVSILPLVVDINNGLQWITIENNG